MMDIIEKTLTDKIMALQDENGCWHVLKEGDKYYPELKYYVPSYKSTLWTLVFLADIGTDVQRHHFHKPLNLISDHFYDPKVGIYDIGKSHYPIPCLNGNMLYLHNYFQSGNKEMIHRVVDFFAEHQRFDDGDFSIPSSFPYRSNHSCYGQHTCYWGVVKLFKGLSFIPKTERSENAKNLIQRCIDFILLHQVCFSSHNPSALMHKGISTLSFLNLYSADFLEILWLLKREEVKSPQMDQALALLKSKIKPDGTWSLERKTNNLIIPIGKQNFGNELVTRRAKEVMGYY